MATALVAPHPVAEGPVPRLWTREEYHRMAEVGILPEGAGMELIDGVIYQKMPQGRAHVTAIRAVVATLRTAFGEGFDINAQAPLPLDGYGEPEPDVLVLRGVWRDYEDRDPSPKEDVVLVVEVSDSSLGFDRRAKVALYARYGIPEYWIVNLRERTLEVRREPNAEGYASTLVIKEGESVEVGGGRVPVAEILPRMG